MEYNLERFLTAQELIYDMALMYENKLISSISPLHSYWL